MRGPVRRLVIGTAVGAVIALAAATGVAAYWQAQAAVAVDVVATGDLTVTASWVGGTPSWPAIYPGDSVEANIAITVEGQGNTLAWEVDAESANIDAAFTFEAFQGNCSTGAELPATGSPDSLTICVRYSLPRGADNDLQGQSFAPQITVTANQVANEP